MGETKRLPDGRTLTFDLPEKLRLAIGDAIVSFSRIETIVLEIIWELRGSDLNEKRSLARRNASQNLMELKEWIEKATPDKFDAIWTTVERLRKERLLVAHGVWMLIDGQIFVLSHKFLESVDEVTAEIFPYDRFEKFMKHAAPIYDMLYKFRQMLPAPAARSK